MRGGGRSMREETYPLRRSGRSMRVATCALRQQTWSMRQPGRLMRTETWTLRQQPWTLSGQSRTVRQPEHEAPTARIISAWANGPGSGTDQTGGLKARSTWRSHLDLDRAFSPFLVCGTVTWGVAPGWYVSGPLALCPSNAPSVPDENYAPHSPCPGMRHKNRAE